MSTIEVSLLTAAEEAALAELLAGPLVGVHVHIAVKFRAMQHDIGTVTIIDHSWQWPIPALFAAANPHPVSLSTHGIQLDVMLTQPAPAAPSPIVVPDANSSADDAASDQVQPVGGDVLAQGT